MKLFTIDITLQFSRGVIIIILFAPKGQRCWSGSGGQLTLSLHSSNG